MMVHRMAIVRSAVVAAVVAGDLLVFVTLDKVLSRDYESAYAVKASLFMRLALGLEILLFTASGLAVAAYRRPSIAGFAIQLATAQAFFYPIVMMVYDGYSLLVFLFAFAIFAILWIVYDYFLPTARGRPVSILKVVAESFAAGLLNAYAIPCFMYFGLGFYVLFVLLFRNP